MYDQIREDTLYIILYAMVTAMAMMASCYQRREQEDYRRQL